MKSREVVDAVVLCVAVIVILANFFGIRLLTRLRRPYTNQIKIIISVSLAEILLSALTISQRVASLAKPQNQKLLLSYLKVIKTAVYFSWYMMFYILMIDRFCGTRFPFWYRSDASRKSACISLIVCWLAIFLIATSISLADQYNPYESLCAVENFIYLVCDSVFILLFFILCCTVFYFKHQSNMRFGRGTRRDENKRFFRITSTILTVFLLLQAIPTAVTSLGYHIIGSQALTTYIELYSSILWQLNLLADPMIYIFMHPEVSMKLSQCFAALCRKSEQDHQPQINPACIS